MIKEIQRLFNEVIKYSQGLDEVCSDSIFENWSNNKSHFIEKWGGLTYELDREIQLDIPIADKIIMFKDFISDASIFSDRRDALKSFLLEQSVEDFYANKVGVKFEYEDIKINCGAKISKSLKFFFDNAIFLDKFQTKMSRMIQDCKITGKMVMSVHPLDFLSSSETNHNWHSCHALDGEYRCGNLSYMQDSHTFMIYIKANEESVLPNFPESVKWNSKKWRVLMYMDKDEEVFVSGRQYPFSNEVAFDIATKELIGKFYPLDTLSNWTCVKDRIVRIMQDGIGALQYNDCLGSPSYTPVAMLSEAADYKIDINTYPKMQIGEATICLECGRLYISLSDEVRCDECGEYTYCECCGDACSYDDMYELEGEMVCADCWDGNGVYCEGCHETYNEIYTDMYWDEEDECCYCQCCYDSVLEKRGEVKEDFSYNEEL